MQALTQEEDVPHEEDARWPLQRVYARDDC